MPRFTPITDDDHHIVSPRVTKVPRRVPLSAITKEPESDRIALEIERYRDVVDVHDLPPIYHRWSHRYVMPKLRACGFDSVEDFFLQPMLRVCRAAPERRHHMASVGAGNCDFEVALADQLRQAGTTNFRFSCVELNPHMVERGRTLADEHGLSEHFDFQIADIDGWQPESPLSICIANHSLHHFVELELLFGKIRDVLGPDGVFLTNDMIGRNGHMRWPEALAVVEDIWAEMPDRYKFNHAFGRPEPVFTNWDCSEQSNEGIRAQDILPLLMEYFHFESFVAFANVIDVFIDRPFGHNFDPENRDEAAFIDAIAERDESLLDRGVVKPTHLLGAMRAVPVERTRCYRHWTPDFCVRRPDDEPAREPNTTIPEPRLDAPTMPSIVNPEVLDTIASHAEAFRNAPYFPHVVIDDFLDPAACQALLDAFPGYEAKHATNELGEVGRKAVREQVRGLGPSFAALDDTVRSEDFTQLMSRITGIPDLLYDAEYVGGGTHDNLNGTELDVHVDFNYHPRTDWHRRLNLILFLNPEWEASWGGCLSLHRNPWSPEQDEHVSVVPVMNRAVLFETSERSWHGFTKITLPEDEAERSRKSFALYFYTLDRPADETAPAHATVYVPRPLPEHLVAGHPLDETDVATLHEMIARRDQQIQFLYHREQEFSTQLGQLRNRVESLRAALDNVPLEGGLSQVARSEGLWEDLWVGERFHVQLRAEQPSDRLRIDGWVPENFPDRREVTVTLGETVHEATLERGPFSLVFEHALTIGDECSVQIRCPDICNPKQDELSEDDRDLTFVLRGIAAES